MKPRLICTLLLVLISVNFFASNSIAATIPNDLFTQLLDESSLQFLLPSDFVVIKTKTNPVQQYERAIRHLSGKLEIRYIIRPLERIAIDYSDPHNAAPEPNHLFPLLFESLTDKLSRAGNATNAQYPQSQALDLFNADWAAASIFDVTPEFSKVYSQALIIAIHKNTKADAYTVFLYNDGSQVKDIIQSVLSNLVFVP